VCSCFVYTHTCADSQCPFHGSAIIYRPLQADDITEAVQADADAILVLDRSLVPASQRWLHAHSFPAQTPVGWVEWPVSAGAAYSQSLVFTALSSCRRAAQVLTAASASSACACGPAALPLLLPAANSALYYPNACRLA